MTFWVIAAIAGWIVVIVGFIASMILKGELQDELKRKRDEVDRMQSSLNDARDKRDQYRAELRAQKTTLDFMLARSKEYGA